MLYYCWSKMVSLKEDSILITKNLKVTLLLVFTENLRSKTGEEEVTSRPTCWLHREIGSGCLRTFHNADNTVMVYCKFKTYAFYEVVWQHGSGEVGNEYITWIFRHFAICLSKTIKIGGNLPKSWQKQICTVFLRHRVHMEKQQCEYIILTQTEKQLIDKQILRHPTTWWMLGIN